jgi:flagellin
MSLNSIDTNVGAMVALQSLNETNSALQTTQKQISTGLRVSDASDDGAAYAVAQRVRSDVGALTSANQQLGNVQGLVSTTITGLNSVSNDMNTMRSLLTSLADNDTSGTERSQYIQQYQSDQQNVKNAFQGAGYNGKTLIGDISGSDGTFSNVSVVQNEIGSTYGIASFSGSAFMASVTFTSTQLASATAMQSALSTTGVFLRMTNEVNTQLNNYGSANTYINNQITYNSAKIDSLNSGLGSMIDADMAKESAQLEALQIRQQLGTQALSIANQAPSSLLTLFR